MKPNKTKRCQGDEQIYEKGGYSRSLYGEMRRIE